MCPADGRFASCTSASAAAASRGEDGGDGGGEAAEAASTVMQMDEVPQWSANRRISALLGSSDTRRATTLVTRGSCWSERAESSSQAQSMRRTAPSRMAATIGASMICVASTVPLSACTSPCCRYHCRMYHRSRATSKPTTSAATSTEAPSSAPRPSSSAMRPDSSCAAPSWVSAPYTQAPTMARMSTA